MNARLIRSALTLDGDSDPSEATILLVECNEPVGRELLEQLRADRYRAAIARSAEHARSLARTQRIRAMVLGTLEAPRGALDLLEEVRQHQSESIAESIWEECLPVIVLSPIAGQFALLRAFEIGADDYVVQAGPYYLELRARLKALLRRTERRPATRLRIGPLEIDTGGHLVRVAGRPVELCRLEYELLVHLARNPTGVCSKQELLGEIWNQRARSGTRTVDSHASRLRRKLNEAGARGLVVNVWGVGYRLI